MRVEFQQAVSLAMATQSNIANRSTSNAWLVDTGANAHITPEIGTNFDLRITHIGNTKIVTASTNFSLRNVLRCPNTSSNLLSVHRFTVDNHCYFLIYPQNPEDAFPREM
ncbi:unnamed protein product [Prunus armeniaca]